MLSTVTRIGLAIKNAFQAAFYPKLGIPSAPLIVYVELTKQCNLKCRHCDIWLTYRVDPKSQKSELGTERLLQVLKKLASKGLVAVDFFGGEPLLHKDLPYIVEKSKEFGLHVTVTTNGYLLADKEGRQLISARPDQILVSIDFPSAEQHDYLRGIKGAFERAVEGVKFAADKVNKVGINTVVIKQNIHELPKLPEFAKSIGARQIRLLPYHVCYPFDLYRRGVPELLPGKEDSERLRFALESFYQNATKLGIKTNCWHYLKVIPDYFAGSGEPIRCLSGLAVCDINAFGQVFPCYTFGQPAGSIQQETFESIWRSDRMESHRKIASHCAACWQSCYVEPSLRLSPIEVIREPGIWINDFIQYVLKK